MADLDTREALAFASKAWEEEIVPALHRYIEIPAKSPAFDPDWLENGHLHRAVDLIETWCRGRPIPGLEIEVIELEGRTPVIWMEIPGTGPSATSRAGASADTVLLYGHLDKQPEMDGWRDELGPWKPVRQGDCLYGRGGADDGYAAFASLTALEILARQQQPHARCVILIEACEESGSQDLPAYVAHLSPRIGSPSLVICLDSGCGDYERLWGTTSLRGMVTGELHVEVLREGVHSGDASGVVPSSFRVLRQLLSRLEDPATGAILPRDLEAPVPQDRIAQARAIAEALGPAIHTKFPFFGSTHPVSDDLVELILNRTWRSALSITGMAGIPGLGDAGNVLRPGTAAKLSLRLPPTVDGEKASALVKLLFEQDPPYAAHVHFEPDEPATGWNAPAFDPWLEASLQRASQACFGKPAAFMGEGGSIPFMGMLGERFPGAQFLITGVLGPGSNAHGPNEFLHVPTAKRLTAAVAQVLTDHVRRVPPPPR